MILIEQTFFKNFYIILFQFKRNISFIWVNLFKNWINLKLKNSDQYIIKYRILFIYISFY
jgi:hypothetical protein